MALTRHWYPTSNKSSRSGSPRLLVIHTTEGFTGPNGMYDCAVYFQGPVGASSHVVIDNYHPGHICECVSRSYASWTQCNYNGQTAASVEQCGYASWSRSVWLNEKEPLLRNVAQWLAEESKHFGIPLVDLSSGSAQGNGWGVCYHSELGSAGCGHSDPGSGYPLDVVLQWANEYATGTVPKPEEAYGDMTASMARDPEGAPHYACIDKDTGAVMYFPPGWETFGRIDPSQGNARSGVDIDINDDWIVTLTYVNAGGAVCTYHHKFRDHDPWVWTSHGGNAR